MTNIASNSVAAPAVSPVVFGVPMPQVPAPDLAGPLTQTLQALAGPGSFRGKSPFIQGGIGRIEAVGADRAYQNAAAQGKFPLSFSVANVDQNGGVVTADVTATAATGGVATQNIVFVAGPSPSGFQVSRSSALALLSAVG